MWEKKNRFEERHFFIDANIEQVLEEQEAILDDSANVAIIIFVLGVVVIVVVFVLICICCCFCCSKNKRSVNSNIPATSTGPNIEPIFQRSSNFPHPQTSSYLPTTTPYKSTRNNFSDNSLILLNAEDELMPPPAIYIIPPIE